METHETPTTLDDVRLAIFRQHTQIAQLLDEVEANAHAVIARRQETKGLHQALELLETRFLRHLAYEETHLTAWLPARNGELSLLGDHDDQRARLRGLRHDRAVFGDASALAREALTLVHHLRKDMVEEDARLRALS